MGTPIQGKSRLVGTRKLYISSFFCLGRISMKFITAKWCCENINSGNIMFKNILSEVKELVEARSLLEVKEEFGDVLYFTYCWLYCKFGINLPLIGAMESFDKFVGRLVVWKMMFYKEGLTFNPKYLINGSNYMRKEKIDAALELARRDQGE